MNVLRKDKTPIAFKAQAGEGMLTLEIYDVIGADFFGEGITASMVSEAIDNAPGLMGIQLNINSPGGDLFEGVAIYNTLKASGVSVNINVMGLCASAASLIAMAGLRSHNKSHGNDQHTSTIFRGHRGIFGRNKHRAEQHRKHDSDHEQRFDHPCSSKQLDRRWICVRWKQNADGEHWNHPARGCHYR